MKSHGKPQPNPPGKYTKLSLALFITAPIIVLLDIVGPIVFSSGNDIISPTLHDQLQFLALLSIPFIPLLLIIGFIIGIIGWKVEQKTLGSRSRMAVVVTFLNLISSLVTIIIFVIAFFSIELNVPS